MIDLTSPPDVLESHMYYKILVRRYVTRQLK